MTIALIVSGGGFQGLGLLEALQRIPGVRPIVADLYPDNVTRYLCPDYVVIPPLSQAEAFAAALTDLVRERGVDAVFPASARELPLLAELRPALEALGARVAVCPPALVETLLDKRATADFLARHGLPTQAPIDPAAHDFAHPLFGKPRQGWGGTGTVVARDAADVRRHLATAGVDGIVWFPLVEGFEEYSADFAIDPSGRISPVVLRQRLRASGGYAVISESVHDAGLSGIVAAAAAAIASAGGCGLFNVQLIRPPGGDAFLSDVNPRFGTSAVHGLFAGMNPAAFFLGKDNLTPTPSGRTGDGTRTVRYLRTLSVPSLAKRPRAVVFDLDDTLVDHKTWMAAKIELAYQDVARGWASEDDFRLRALQLVDEGERALLIDRIAAFFSWTDEQRWALIRAYRRARVPRTPVYPDVEPVLDALRDAGFALALLTDNPVETQRSKIEAAPELHAIASITYASTTGGEKPSATAFAAAAQALNLPPGDLCMVGDNYFRDALGAIRGGYGSAFVIKRHGGFVQHHPGIVGLTAGRCAESIHLVESLTVMREALLATP